MDGLMPIDKRTKQFAKRIVKLYQYLVEERHEKVLSYMKRFAASWPRRAILQAPIAKLPWFSQIALIEKLETREDRLGYARLAVENHWLRPQLVREIAARSIENLGKSTNNFALTMPIADADKAITDGLTRLLEK